MSSNTRADTMAASAPCAKLLAAFMGLGCVIVQKASSIQKDDEWRYNRTDFQRKRKHCFRTIISGKKEVIVNNSNIPVVLYNMN